MSKYYPQRPSEMEDVCLHDFVTHYNWQGKDKQGNRMYRMLTKPRLIQHKYFDPAKPEEREDYFYSLVVLFVPYREESSLLQENETTEQAFNRLLPENRDCTAYHERLQAMLRAEAHVRSIEEARRAQEAVNKTTNDDDDGAENGMEVKGEVQAAMEEVMAMEKNKPDTLTLQQREDMLNADQKRVYDKIKTHLLHQIKHEKNECHCDNLKPMSHFVSGVGGTGKSFLIEALTNSLWPMEDVKCAVTAPTGLASFIVGGMTILRLLQLPIEHKGKEESLKGITKVS